jgi:hypothetical protein
MAYRNPSARELYSDYKQTYEELVTARRTEITDEELDNAGEFREIIETIELEVSFQGMDPETTEYVQELLSLRAEAQNPITAEKIALKMSKILGAQARLNIHNYYASDILTKNFDKYYKEALLEETSRNKG